MIIKSFPHADRVVRDHTGPGHTGPHGPHGHGAGVVPLRPAPATTVRLGLVGASILVREGLRAILRPRADAVVLVDESEVSPRTVDVVLVDVHSTAPLGPHHVDALRAEGHAVVWAFGWGSSESERRLLRLAGAHGYLSMRHEERRLVEILLESFTPSVAARSHARTSSVVRMGRDLDLDALTPREIDVVTLICRGLTNAEISTELHITVNTVKSFVRTAYRKLDITNRTQCMLWGMARGV